jgi:soluble lytic murein transglycosylase-like protein
MALAPVFGVDPKVAVSVAIVESNMNYKAIGQAGEIGLFQIMPDIAKRKGFTKKQLLDPVINTYLGLEMLQEAQNHCTHRGFTRYLVCYNYGARNAKRVHHPDSFPYVKKVNKELKNKSYQRFLADAGD